MAVLVGAPPCVLYEDEHLLAACKPPGLNTHSPAPYAGEGIYEWLRCWAPRWATLAIIHRLDKGTSGVMVFAKTKAANKSLTEQFARRQVRKTYLFLSTVPPGQSEFTVRTHLARVGEKYQSAVQGDLAETKFRALGAAGAFYLYSAQPLTGRTHQIRVHASENGVPILGDTTYGGAPFERVCLHAERLELRHPSTGAPLCFSAEAQFLRSTAELLREATIDPDRTNAYRVLHGASDRAGYYLDRWNGFLLAQSESSLPEIDLRGAKALYGKHLNRHVSRASQEEAAPRLVKGEPAPPEFEVLENGVRYEISFEQGYSVGLFLDQRENRRRLLQNYIAPGFPIFEKGLAGKTVLNAFAYTCGFSVCAALGGASTTSLDLSRKYLDWGQRNFERNQLDPGQHDFIFGDVFEWAERLRRKGRQFDLILLDPPTFSRSKNRVFQAERDFSALVAQVLPLLSPDGVLFASTNAHKLPPGRFVGQIEAAIQSTRRTVKQSHYVPQPVDFPISPDEPAYLKTCWLRAA